MTIEKNLKPILSEKVSIETDKNNIYGFMVPLEANKYHIKAAVEKKYNVKVVDINTATLAGKTKRFGKFAKKTAHRKKAYVKLADGQKIEFFKGV